MQRNVVHAKRYVQEEDEVEEESRDEVEDNVVDRKRPRRGRATPGCLKDYIVGLVTDMI